MRNARFVRVGSWEAMLQPVGVVSTLILNIYIYVCMYVCIYNYEIYENPIVGSCTVCIYIYICTIYLAFSFYNRTHGYGSGFWTPNGHRPGL